MVIEYYGTNHGNRLLCTSKKHNIILKFDFKKAFDKVEHQLMLEIMAAKDLSVQWLNWMRQISSSGTSAVLLNGVPWKVFHCLRGVRQGDPLSPLLFVCRLATNTSK
jgi:hypothetical protein